METARVGHRLPKAKLARMSGGEIVPVQLERLLEARRVVLVGLPGAFTPVCTGRHLPELIRESGRLKASGIAEIICIAPNSPWVIDEWAKVVDPDRKLTFLSDGNMDFVHAAGLTTRAAYLFLGHCSKRYSMIVRDGVVEKLSVEDQVELLNCTRPSQLLD